MPEWQGRIFLNATLVSGAPGRKRCEDVADPARKLESNGISIGIFAAVVVQLTQSESVL